MLRNQIKTAGSITAICNDDGQLVFDHPDIEDNVVSHFKNMFQASDTSSQDFMEDQEEVNEAMKNLNKMRGQKENDEEIPYNKFERTVCAPYTFTELSQILQELPNGKSSGYDQVPNELLKNAGNMFRNYLLIFLNRIMDEGVVPKELNRGKCLLIHKVRNNLNKNRIGHRY